MHFLYIPKSLTYFCSAPFDPHTHPIDDQLTWGSALVISPVLREGARHVRAYLPPRTLPDRTMPALWFDLHTGARINSGWVDLDAPLNTIPVHIRGGSIVPTQTPDVTTYYSFVFLSACIPFSPSSSSAFPPLKREAIRFIVSTAKSRHKILANKKDPLKNQLSYKNLLTFSFKQFGSGSLLFQGICHGRFRRRDN